nr:amidohydrolase [Lachnospiraceae bacterium]
MERILYNGRIITMEKSSAERELMEAPEAVWVKDGRIKAVGRFGEIEKAAGKNAVKQDLNGKCLMPSFIDTHSHIMMNGYVAGFADLSECQSFDEIIAVLKDYMMMHNLTGEDVLYGFGYDHNFLKEDAHPDKRVLDRVSKEIPIFVLHISAHLACANSRALELAGISSDTPNPEGGIIGRLPFGNEPSGYVEEAGMNALQRVIMPRLKIDSLHFPQKMQEIYLSNGITTAQDGASMGADIKALLDISASGSLKLDVVSYPLMTGDGMDVMADMTDYAGYRNRFRMGGYKLVLDGSPQGRSAWMSEPYQGGDGKYCGYPWMKENEVSEYVKRAVMEGKQILAHCNGDAASGQFIQAYEKALTEVECKRNLRPVMIHCQTVRNDQLDKMAKLNMIASIFVGHVWYWGDTHLKNFGIERGNHISPVKDAMDRGIMVTFHQDTPVTKPDMLHSVWAAVNRVSRGGNIIGEEQTVDVYAALKSVTINAAYQYFEEDFKGSIAKGKRADLVVLDDSPLEVAKMEIRNIKVLE